MQARYYARASARRRSSAVIDVLRAQDEEEPGLRDRGLAVRADHGLCQPDERVDLAVHGHVAVVPVRVASPDWPQLTTQSEPTQFSTVQPLAGQVTWHSPAPAQSTVTMVLATAWTWHSSVASQLTSHGWPGWHCT